jgi:hypothetical protein
LGNCCDARGRPVRLDRHRGLRRQGAVPAWPGVRRGRSARGGRLMTHRCRDYCFRCDLVRLLRAVLVHTAPKPPKPA